MRSPDLKSTVRDVTEILNQINEGKKSANDELLILVYDELRKLARYQLSQERVGQTLQPTALVHEAYLRLLGPEIAPQNWENRGHFYAAASEAMRRILIESARHKATLKQGGDRQRLHVDVDFPDSQFVTPNTFLTLNDALETLQQEDPDCFRIVLLRFFGGLTVEEAAVASGISERTAKRQWSFARAWLKTILEK